MTGAEAMVKCLEAEGITKIFGYPGVAIAPFYEGLYGSAIEHILVRQEQNAGHAASGYARISRKTAVCTVTSSAVALSASSWAWVSPLSTSRRRKAYSPTVMTASSSSK